ncbi:MAG: single-stranded DNA-binding protein [Clostridia bacterium]
MNSVVLIGRLTRDPEIRYIPESQMAVATFTVAIDRPVRSGQEKKTDFPRVTVFGRQAENCERFLAKGRLVGVQGRIQTGSYTNKDGVTVYTTDVVADRVEFWNGATETKDQAAAADIRARSHLIRALPIETWAYLKDFRHSRMMISRSKRKEIISWIIKDVAA